MNLTMKKVLVKAQSLVMQIEYQMEMKKTTSLAKQKVTEHGDPKSNELFDKLGYKEGNGDKIINSIDLADLSVAVIFVFITLISHCMYL